MLCWELRSHRSQRPLSDNKEKPQPNWLRAVPIVTNNDGCSVVRYLAVVAGLHCYSLITLIWSVREYRLVYTFDAVKRYDTLSHASQMRMKAFCGVSVYTFHAGISARQLARESVTRRTTLQSSTVLNVRALRQRTHYVRELAMANQLVAS